MLFLPYLPAKLGWEVEIRYVLVGALNVPFGDLNLSAPFQLLSTLKKWFFGQVFAFLSFLEFVSRITPLKIELGS